MTETLNSRMHINQSPATAVFIGPIATTDEAIIEFKQQHPKTEITQLTPLTANTDMIKQPRFELAVLIDAIEFLDKQSASHLLAAMRDIHTQSLILVCRLGPDWEGLNSHWTSNELLGFGMKRLAHYQQTEKPVGVYQFNLHDYKGKPNWLNSSHWAHPEQWDKNSW